MKKHQLTENDINDTIDRYTKRYQEFGYSPKSLGWHKGKQEVRFDILTSMYSFHGKNVLDIGCGFGDLNKVLQNAYQDNYAYFGIDLVPDLINEAKARYHQKTIQFEVGDFLTSDIDFKPDFAIASGIFNHKLENDNNYEVIEQLMQKAFMLCKDGFAFDFLSDKVDFKLDHTFHSDPSRILNLAYKLSKNVVLRNDYMPFEFSIFVFKDDTFSKDDTLFNRYKNK